MSKAAKIQRIAWFGLGLVSGLLAYHFLVPLEQPPFQEEHLLFNAETDAAQDVAAARRRAQEGGKFLMVIFGANWCIDCRTLELRLKSSEVAEYTAGRFEFAHVDVGKFNNNLQVASEYGINLQRGIPVALAFAPDGGVIGATNDGELDPARFYSSQQILRFVRNIAEHSRIVAPDSAQ
jgi:thiol:disulfide interchange protein